MIDEFLSAVRAILGLTVQAPRCCSWAPRPANEPPRVRLDRRSCVTRNPERDNQRRFGMSDSARFGRYLRVD